LAEEKVSVIDYSKEVIQVTRDLNRAKANLKKLQREFEFAGTKVTQSDINRQQRLVDTYQQVLEQLTEETEIPFIEQIKTKQQELKERQSRATQERLSGQISQDVSLPVGPEGQMVSGQLTAETQRIKKTQLPKEFTASKDSTDAAQGSGPGSSVRGVATNQIISGGRSETRTLIDVPENSLIVRNTDGTFDVNEVKSIFVYDRSQNRLQPQSIDDFKNGLYTLTPNAIAEYKKGLGYKAEDINGVLTDRFTQDIVDAAKAVSEYSFGYAQSGLKAPIDLIQYLSNSQSYPEISSIVKQQKSGGTETAIDANRLAANVDTVRLLEVELGASLTKQQRDKIARDLATGRVNATTLRSTIVQTGKLSLDEGEAASLKAELKQNAAINGVDLGEAWFDRITQNILQGKMSRETADTEILKQAKMKYAAPSLVAGLDAGFTIRDQVTPQINWLAQMRGVDPDSISLNDPILAKALINVNNEGMPVQMDSINWENWAKENDPAYATSSMAEEQYSSALRVMGQAFGRSI
jgi:hypothetical protein